MEAYLDALVAFLVQYVLPSMPNTTQVILGDPGTSAPASLPAMYVVPLFDTVKALSTGVDMDTYVIPLLLIADLNAYGPPIQNVNVPSAQALEQPGYRKLMEWAQIIRAELRAGGQAITLNGQIATSIIPAISYVWVTIDNKSYRGVRLAVQAQQRRVRRATP